MTQRKRKQKTKIDEELMYEKQPRWMKARNSGKKKTRVRTLLPIKTASGKIIQQSYEEELPQQENTEENQSENASLKKKDVVVVKSTNELIKSRKEIIEEKKSYIANVVSEVMANPEGNIMMIKNLRLLLEDRDNPECMLTVRKLVTAALGCLFVDITPGYRIRLRTEKEKEVKLSKEVKARFTYEENFLVQYQAFLKCLEKMIKKRISPGKSIMISASGSRALGEIAVHAMASLFTATPHFNYHSNIVMMFVPIANNDRDPAVRKLCCDAISTLFSTDKKSVASLNTIKTMARLAKKQGPRKLTVEFMSTLLSLRIKIVDYSMIKGRNKYEKRKKALEMKKLSRKQRKQLKKEKDINNEMKELAATEDYDDRVKTHTEIIQQVFLIYFRILKHKNGESRDCQVILPTVLEGLAKYAHLINITFFGDLIKVLQRLVAFGGLSLRENLHSVYSVFTILSGQGEVINVDPVEFYKLVYNICIQFLESNNKSDVLKILLDCIHLMLDKRRKHVTFVTLCAFIKRLSAVALQLTTPKDVVSVLKQIEALLLSNSKTRSLFDVESMTIGEYDAESEEPLHSKSQSAVMWDLHLLRRHYSPLVHKPAMQMLIKGAKQ